MHLRSLALFLLLCASVSSAQYIKEILVKIPDVDDAELEVGDSFQLEITNAVEGSLPCRTKQLLNPYDSNMQRNEVDVYSGDVLDNCEDFDLPGGEISQLTLINQSNYSFGVEWVRFLMSNNGVIECDIQQLIDANVVVLDFPGSVCSTPY